jgi:L-cysteine desulfidase
VELDRYIERSYEVQIVHSLHLSLGSSASSWCSGLMENHSLDAIAGITKPAAQASGSSSWGITKSIPINNETQAASHRTYAGKEKAAQGATAEESALSSI